MTRKDKKIRLARSFLFPVIALAASGALANTVQLEVNASETALTYGAGSSHGRCANDPSPGCIRVSGKSSIRFVLTGDRRCSSGSPISTTPCSRISDGRNLKTRFLPVCPMSANQPA